MAVTSSSDDNHRENFRERLLEIDVNLGNCEVEQLKFLCRDFVPSRKLEESSSAMDIFYHLLAGELLSEEDPFLLAELLYIMKQILLLKHLNYTKEQVESLLPMRKRVSPFRNLLYELAENIDSENLKSMTFLQKESMPKIPLNSISFLVHMEKQALIDENNLAVLENLCTKVAPHLTRKIEKYKREKASQVVTSPVKKETESLPQGEEEVYSSSNFKQAHGAIQEAAVYQMNRKFRGHCVIINNHTFTSTFLEEREGTNKDAECLKLVFQWLGFRVIIRGDVTEKELEEILQNYKRRSDLDDGDCFVFCVLTHGRFGAVYSSDGVLIPIQKITSHFTARECPGLANKPKLFFVQACQGEEIQPSIYIKTDAINPELTNPPLQDSVPDEADFLLGLATVPGYVSFRHKKEGSWYIQSLCNHLKDLVPRHEDILSILTAVNDDVSRRGGTKKQMPQPVFTLRKKVVFPVPQKELS